MPEATTVYFGDTPYRDGSGRPRSGAVLTFWRSGTTEHAAVYVDANLESAHELPITANEAGVFAAIYLDSTITTA